eukprot:TRINITY_DN15266_c0_g1_i1.p1 TRINITY_DN15266_c0_g1~~TRINITY_DN15266_c0_g1_i1.p1  ORF type:complete len:106 (+),score=16.76 TRINITY_DN15266_c0_g1_i1:24-341(+)
MSVWRHIVLLEFDSKLSDDFIEKHFKNDVKLKERMPELVISWEWAKNIHVPENRAKNLTHIVIVSFKSLEDIKTYLTHPQHKEVVAIQGPYIKDKVVMDMEGPNH